MVAFTPSFPSMAPTAQAFNYQPPPSNDLQTIMGGLKGTGSTLGLPWAAGNTAQPGITTPMARNTGPLNPAGVNAYPYGGGPPGAPAAPAAPKQQYQGPPLDSGMQFKLNAANAMRQRMGQPALTPGTPEYNQWVHTTTQQGQFGPGGSQWAGPGGGR